MRSLITAVLTVLFATPALAQTTPIPSTASEPIPSTASGLGIRQNGLPVPLMQDGAQIIATLAPGPFTFTYPTGPSEEMAVLFTTWDGFDQFRVPEDMDGDMFHFALAYAGEERPHAPLFLTDYLCAGNQYLPGHNLLRAGAWLEAGFPVTELRVDGQSRECDAVGRLPDEVNLLHLLSPIFATVRTRYGTERLTLQFTAR